MIANLFPFKIHKRQQVREKHLASYESYSVTSDLDRQNANEDLYMKIWIPGFGDS